MSRMRIAVTGGSGNIGRIVVRHLVERGHDVINIDRCQSRDPVAKFVFLDLRNRTALQPLLENVDAVIHLGEIPSAGVEMPPEEIFATNTAIASTVLQTAADLKLKRFIYTSTCQVYGTWGHPTVAPQSLPLDETHPLQPQNVYSLSKTASESYARYVSKESGLSVAIFRLPWVVHHDLNDKLVEWFERETGPSEGIWTYVRGTDVAEAYALAIENPRPGCEAYHLSASEIMSANPFRDRLKQHYPHFPPLPADWPALKSPLLTHKAREHFGWEPKWNFLEFYRSKFGRNPVPKPL